MKRLFVAAVLLVIALSMSFGQGTSTSAVTYVDHDKVAAAIANGGALANGPDFAVSIAKRTAAGQVEIHDKETDTFYILDGEATFVTGGTIIGGRVSRPSQQLGTDIQGGQTHHLTKGDVITIPAGLPHWFKEVTKPVTYYMVKIIKP
jgi:mannose-6-phosphate isomerase-like protein (cupin superfamily)